MRMQIAALLLIALTASLEAAPPVRALSPRDLVGRPEYQRWVFVPSGAAEDLALVDYVTLNTVISRRSVPVRLQRLVTLAAAAGEPIPVVDRNMLRIDLAEASASLQDLRELLDTWEQLALDEPYFLAHAVRNADGKTITRLPHREPTIGPLVARLQFVHQTQVPIVRWDYLFTKTITQVDGGLYYRFAGVDATQDKFLQRVAGITDKQAQQNNSGSKALQLISEIGGLKRAILFFHGTKGRTALNQNLAAVTYDMDRGNRNPASDPFRNPVTPKHDASEIIVERANGTLVYGLFNGAGKRQDEAPPGVVKDHEIPKEYGTARVNGALCMFCHGPEDGWRSVKHDLLDLDFLTDLRKQNDPDAVDALLADKVDKPLRRARDDYSDGVVNCTQHYGLDLDAKGLMAHGHAAWKAYNAESVDQAKAVEELAAITRRNFAGKQLAEILYDVPRSDPDRQALLKGKRITRKDFEVCFPDLVQDLIPEAK